MEKKIERLLSWANGKKVSPTTIELNPTERCNLRCKSCWQRANSTNKNELSTDRLLSIVKEAAKLGVKEFRIPGSGEPLMRKDIINVMKEIKKNDLEGLLITNGTLFTKEIIEELIEISWDCITFSIDGPNAKINDYLRGCGAFDKIIENLRLFKKIKKGKGKDQPLIRFNVVLSNQNYNKLHEMILLAHKMGCKAVQFQAMTVWGKEGQKLILNKKQKEELPIYIKKAKELGTRYNIFTQIENSLEIELVNKTNEMNEFIKKRIKMNKNEFLSLPCFEPFYNMIILPDGSIGPCAVFGREEGDNITEKSLQDVWHGEIFDKIRERLLNRQLFQFCKQCCAAVHVENIRIRNKLVNFLDNE